MPKIAYQQTRFSKSSLALIAAANRIIEEYRSLGFTLTLRQLYYQFVSRDIIPNNQREYKRLGSVVNDGRMAGLIDWESIEDRGRNLQTFPSWEHPRDILRVAANQFRLDPWEDQPCYVEVWVEKEALIGVVASACESRRVPHFACKGYTSQSEMWSAGHHRLRPRIERGGKEVHILHLGDHDPSGIDMTRDIEDRLAIFSVSGVVEVHRLALNMDQVEALNPPPNPAKTTDSRFESYMRTYGNESWELDAIDPTQLAAIIQAAIEPLIDEEEWETTIRQEEHHRAGLAKLATSYNQ